MALEAENALAALPTIRKVLEGVEARTIERIKRANQQRVRRRRSVCGVRGTDEQGD